MRRTLLILLTALLITPTVAIAGTDYRYGSPIQHQNLTVVPVYPPKGAPTMKEEYLTFTEASEKELIKVTELDGNTDAAEVSAVHVTSSATKPIFLMAGEVILGGKQDRIISKNTIVEPRSKKLKVGVFCVEQGRWEGKEAVFAASGKVGHSKLRKTAMFDDNQQAVWNEVDEQNKKSKVAPETGTYRATLEKKQRAADAIVEALLPKLEADPRALGVVVAIDGELASMDAFASPKLFAAVRNQLMRSYALAAVSSENKVSKSLPKKTLTDLNEHLEEAEKKAKKKSATSGAAANEYYDGVKSKRAVTKSKDGQAVHDFIDF